MEPVVPRSEIEARVRSFQAGLRADGLDAALVVQTTDLYYLTGTAQNAHLILSADGQPSLLVRKSLERARAESPLERVEPLRSLRELPAALAAAGVEQGRLGLELDVLPAARYLDYAARLRGFELGDCTPALRRARVRKSAWELDRIRRAAKMLSRVGDWVGEVLVEGMTEIELAAELERFLRREGHQGVLRMRAFNGEVFYGTIVAGPSAAVPGGTDTPIVGPGPNAAVAKGASARPIGRGEPVLVDLVASCDGYLADQTRTFSLGPLGEELREAYGLAHSILESVAAASRPSVTGAELYDLAQELVAGRAGFMGAGEERVSFVGHGFGLEIDEPPFLARGYDEPLEEGMVFALEPKFVFPGRGGVGVENSYAVTAEGVEKLTSCPEELTEL